jgi:hypothetical protein
MLNSLKAWFEGDLVKTVYNEYTDYAREDKREENKREYEKREDEKIIFIKDIE